MIMTRLNQLVFNSFCLIIVFVLQIPLLSQSSNNLGFIETLRIGRGAIQYVEWQPNGSLILIDTVREAWLYSLNYSRLEDVAHIENARAAHFSPDGKLLLGANEQNEITVWDTTALVQTATLAGHDDYILSLEWQPNTNYLASLDRSGHIILWNMMNLEKIVELELKNADQIAWSPSGIHLAAIDFESGLIHVWNTIGELLFTATPQYSLKYGAGIIWRNDTQLLQHDFDEIPRGVIWDAITGESTVFHRTGYMNAYSPDGSKLAEVSGSATIFDAASGAFLSSVAIINPSFPSWSPNSQYVAFGGWKPSIHSNAYVVVADGETGTIISESSYDFSIKGIYWSPDSEQYLVVDSANQIFVSNSNITSSITHTEIGSIAAWRDDGQMIAASDTNYGTRLWDANTGEVIASRMHQGQPASKLAWQPGGTLLATAVGDKWEAENTNIYIWDSTLSAVSYGEKAFAIPHVFIVADMAWSPDGRTLASVERNQYVRLWQPDNPNVIDVIDTRAIRVTPDIDYTQKFGSIDWNTQGDVVNISVSGSGNWGSISLINVDEKAIILGSDTPPNYASTWIWTPDNRLIWAKWGRYGNRPPVHDISVGGEGITDRFTDHEKPPLLLSGLEDEVTAGIFSPDARLLIGFDKLDNGIIWDVETQMQLAQLNNVHLAVWSPDSTMVAVYGTDEVIRVLDSQTGDLIHTFGNHFTGNVIWSPDSRRIALLENGVIFIYDKDK